MSQLHLPTKKTVQLFKQLLFFKNSSICYLFRMGIQNWLIRKWWASEIVSRCRREMNKWITCILLLIRSSVDAIWIWICICIFINVHENDGSVRSEPIIYVDLKDLTKASQNLFYWSAKVNDEYYSSAVSIRCSYKGWIKSHASKKCKFLPAAATYIYLSTSASLEDI